MKVCTWCSIDDGDGKVAEVPWSSSVRVGGRGGDRSAGITQHTACFTPQFCYTMIADMLRC